VTRLDLTTVTLAGRLVVQAAADGIAVDHVSLSPSSIRIYAEDHALTPALAVSLGLIERSELLTNDGQFEFFKGRIDDVFVQTHGPIPAPEQVAS